MTTPFIVAEISSNHYGDKFRALDLIMAAKTAGADAVKFQVYTPEEIAADCLIKSGPWAGRYYQDLYREGETPREWLDELFTFARSIGIVPFASPFSENAVTYLETLDCPIYKIASPEIVHLPLIAACARTGKPLIISTGMAGLDEIYEADEVARSNDATDITYLHCISAYPANAEDFNLETMVRLRNHNFHVGLSDHSLSNVAAVAAVALGAIVIEKHFTIAPVGGPDSAFSLLPGEFSEMVVCCRAAAKAMGTVQFGCRDSEKDSYQYRRSLWVARDIQEGQILTSDDIAVLRPNYGASPRCLDIFVGARAKCDLKAGTPLFGADLE